MKPLTRREFLHTSGSLAAASAGLSGLACPGARRQDTPGSAGSRASSRPNLLFLFPDQHRPDWTAANPAIPVPTPNLTALAERGVTFERAVCASPVCAPSRACLASGREYDHCGVATNRDSYPRERPTFYGQLRQSGYRVLGCGKMDLSTGDLMSGHGLGTDGRRHLDAWGFSDGLNNAGKGAGSFIYLQDPPQPRDSYYAYLDALQPPMGRICAEDYARRNAGDEKQDHWGDTSPSPLDDSSYCDNWVARNGLALLDATPVGDPWFLVVNFMGPHQPMDITESMARRYLGPDRVISDFPPPHDYAGSFDAAKHLAIRQNYAAMIENIDRWVGIYLERLAERGELDNTIVVYASDHGEMLGDHSLWGKTVPYQPSVGVPLMVSGPGIRQRHRSDALVSLIDLTATFLDYGGAAELEGMEGGSLRPILEGRTEHHRDYVLSGLYDWRLVFDGRHKLITNYGGEELLLFDLADDPLEDTNLAAAQPARCRDLLETMRRGSDRPASRSAA